MTFLGVLNGSTTKKLNTKRPYVQVCPCGDQEERYCVKLALEGRTIAMDYGYFQGDPGYGRMAKHIANDLGREVSSQLGIELKLAN